MFNNKRIPYIELLPIIVITIIAFKIITSIGSFTLALGKAFSIFSYFVWGFCIAYLLNPLMVYMERKLKLKRVFCLCIIYFLFIGAVTLSITLITPGIVKSISDLLQSLPGFIINTQSLLEHNEIINDIIQKYNLYSYINSHISLIIEKANSFLSLALNMTLTQIISFTSIFFKFTA
jgi:predicted PurR-regulated permease PerM